MTDSVLVDEISRTVGSRREATWIVQHVEDPDQARLLAHRRAAGEPLQYVLGTWPFRTIELCVDPRALIPRPETEQTVQAACDRWAAQRPGAAGLWLLDLGTGSGAIGLSLATELSQAATIEKVVLTDRSPAALELARQNAATLRINATFLLGSWGEAVPSTFRGRFHLLVTNPPYVSLEERGDLDPVLDYEPDEALVAGDGSDGTPGFADVETAVSHAWWLLSRGGVAAVEMAEHHVGAATRRAARLGFCEPQVFHDLAGHPRGITVVRP